MQEIVCRVSGKVQGVFFRDFIAEHARALSLAGYVKNMPDGTVEIVAQGRRTDLEKLVELARHGSSYARIAEAAAEWRKAKETFNAFDVVF